MPRTINQPKTMQVKYKSGLRQIEYLNTVPAGWVKLEGATTAPKGFAGTVTKKVYSARTTSNN